MLPKHTIEMNLPRNGLNSILGENYNPGPARAKMIHQFSQHPIQILKLAANPWIIRTPFLQAIVQMREINQSQRRIKFLIDTNCCVGDPLRGPDRCHRPPKLKEWELAQFLLQLVAKFGRIRIDIRNLSPIGWIHGPRGDRPVCAGVHVVPPEQIGAGELWVLLLRAIPDLGPSYEPVGLLPELDLALIAEVPAVADDTVLRRPGSGQISRLNRRRHRRNDRT